MKTIKLAAISLGASLLLSTTVMAAPEGTMATGPSTVAKKDITFFTEAAQAGMKEVKAGELAQQKATGADTKALADMMVKDHTAKNDELKAIAMKKGVTLPMELKKDYEEDIASLNRMDGVAFDKDYAKLMVKDHTKVISLFQTESKKTKDSDLKNFSSNTLPALRHHLEMSKADAVGVPKS